VPTSGPPTSASARPTGFDIPGSSGSKIPYIAAVDPEDPDTLYVRTYGIPGALLQSRDGGETFLAPFEAELPIQGFALSPDGKTIVASNPFEGTFVADRDTFEFEKLRCGGPSCLGFAGSDLFGCGHESLDGFVVGLSRDRGATFTRVLAQSCIPGPISCPAESGAGAVCPDAWPALEAQLGAENCSPVDVDPNASCFSAGGAQGSEGGSAGSEQGASKAGGASPGPTRSADDSGCRLRTAPRGNLGVWLGFGFALALAVAKRRRVRVASRAFLRPN
jgi:hypothetical protein